MVRAQHQPTRTEFKSKGVVQPYGVHIPCLQPTPIMHIILYPNPLFSFPSLDIFCSSVHSYREGISPFARQGEEKKMSHSQRQQGSSDPQAAPQLLGVLHNPWPSGLNGLLCGLNTTPLWCLLPIETSLVSH